MSKIKNLADEIRGQLSSPAEKEKQLHAAQSLSTSGKFFKKIKAIEDFEIEGEQKMVIRLDPKSHMLLKQFKMTSGIDMAKVILFAFKEFTDSNPWIREYIKEQLNNNQL